MSEPVPAGRSPLDSHFAVGKHGLYGAVCKVERYTLNFKS